MPAQPLWLEVADFIDADHWRWVLQEHGGALVADHTVALAPASTGTRRWRRPPRE